MIEYHNVNVIMLMNITIAVIGIKQEHMPKSRLMREDINHDLQIDPFRHVCVVGFCIFRQGAVP